MIFHSAFQQISHKDLGCIKLQRPTICRVEKTVLELKVFVRHSSEENTNNWTWWDMAEIIILNLLATEKFPQRSVQSSRIVINVKIADLDSKNTHIIACTFQGHAMQSNDNNKRKHKPSVSRSKPTLASAEEVAVCSISCHWQAYAGAIHLSRMYSLRLSWYTGTVWRFTL